MTIRELIEKRNKLLVDARALMAGSDLTTETRARVDTILSDANVLKSDIERLEASAESEERALPNGRPPRDGVESGEQDDRTPEQRNRASNAAFRAYLGRQPFEQRDLTVAADGAVMIPTAALPPTFAQRSSGTLYDVVNHIRTTTGEPISMPLWDDTATAIVLDSKAVGTGTDPIQAGVTLKVDGLRLGDPLLIDNKLIQDLDYDLITYVNTMFLERYQRGVASFIQSGDASAFVGLGGNVPATTTTGTIGVVGYKDIVALITALDPAYSPGACFAFSNNTLGQILQIEDTNGRPLFIPFMDGAASGFAGTILGYPVKLNQYAPPIANSNVPILFGDFFKGYALREVRPGVLIKQSSQRYIELNRLGVVAFARAGGAPTLANNTTYSPIQGLTVLA